MPYLVNFLDELRSQYGRGLAGTQLIKIVDDRVQIRHDSHLDAKGLKEAAIPLKTPLAADLHDGKVLPLEVPGGIEDTRHVREVNHVAVPFDQQDFEAEESRVVVLVADNLKRVLRGYVRSQRHVASVRARRRGAVLRRRLAEPDVRARVGGRKEIGRVRAHTHLVVLGDPIRRLERS